MRFLFLSVITTICIYEGISQDQIKIQISRIDSLGWTDTAYFGVDTRATYCIDTSLGEGLIWWQACGLVPCLAFIDVRTGSGACLAWGTPVDLRPYYSTTQVDTYQLKFDGYTPLVFHWQHNIADFYDAMTFMNNVDPSAATVKVNMLTQDSFVLNISQYWRSDWYIRAESPHPLTDVRIRDVSLPAVPSLSQNYPNPFNPSTTVGFSLGREAVVTITVYDVLGREVKVLAKDRQFSRGEHKLLFSAGDLSSGIYYCRLITTNGRTGRLEYTDVKKMAICK